MAETKHVKTVAVDFDGVLHRYSRGWQGGEIYDVPVHRAGESLRKLLDAGYAVFIHTTRDPDLVAIWCGAAFKLRMAVEEETSASNAGGITVVPGVRFWNRRDLVLVTNRKLPATAYIDDRAVTFRNWEQALSALGQSNLEFDTQQALTLYESTRDVEEKGPQAELLLTMSALLRGWLLNAGWRT